MDLNSRSNVSRVHQWFLASTTNMDARNHLKSTENIEQEQRRQIMSGYGFIIHPFSSFRYWWNCLMCIAIYMLPIIETFALTFEQKEVSGRPSEELVFVKLLMTTCIVFTMVDLVFNFLTGYYDFKRRTVELSKRAIAVRYLTSIDFYRNLVALLPSYVIVLIHEYQTGHDQYGPIDTQECNLRDIVSIITFAKVWRFSEVTVFLSKHERFSTNNKTFWKFVNLLMYTTVLHHFSACLVVNIFSLTEVDMYKDITHKCHMDMPDSWIICERIMHIYKDNVFGKYFKCLIRVACILAMFGEGVGVNNSYVDRVVTIILRLLGLWHILYIINYITIVVRASFTGERKFEVIKGYIEEMARHKKLPTETKRKLIKFFEHKYDTRFINEMKIMSLLSPQLRKEVMNHCRKHLIKDIPYFSNLSDDLTYKLIEVLQTEIHMPNDIVLKEGTIEKALYILVAGTASVTTEEEDDLGVVWKMEPGAYFGQICFIEEEHEVDRTITALEICEFKVLFREDFLKIMAGHRDVLNKIQDTLIEEFIISDRYYY